MNILIKHTLRSIKSNWGQFAVIIMTIMVVTAMLFVAFSIGDLFYNFNVSVDSRLGSSTDISLSGDLYSKAKLNEFINDNSKDIEFVDNYLQMGALFKNENASDKTSKLVMVEATDTKIMAKRYPNMLKISEELKGNYEYPSVWVGKSFVDENNLNIGDEIKIYLDMYRTYQTMTITYIFENEGFFANNVVNNLIIDYESINAKGMYNLSYIKLVDSGKYDEISTNLYDYMGNDNLSVSRAVDYEKVHRIVNNNQLLLNVSLIFIVALMLFILFTSYLVVANKRISEIVVFRAAGATPMQTTLIMLLESAIYGTFGAVLGIMLGRLGMGIAVRQVIPNFASAVTYDFSDYFVSLILGIGISIFASLIPIVNISKVKIRQLTTGSNNLAKKVSPLVFVIVTLLMVSNILVLIFVENATIVATVTLTIIVATWVALIVPYIIKLLSKLFSMGKGSHRIAGLSIKRNTSSRTLASMVGSIIVFTFLVVSIISIVISAITPSNERFEADFVAQSVDKIDYQEIRQDIIGTVGVQDAFLINMEPSRLVQGNQTYEYTTFTVENSEAINSIAKGVTKEVKTRFDMTLHPIILSYDMAQRCGLEIGDKMQIELGNKEITEGKLDNEFVVVGMDYAKTNNDRCVVISASDLMQNGVLINANSSLILVNAKKGVWVRDLYLQLRDNLEQKYCYILKYDDWAYATNVGMRGIQELMKILQILVSVVALIGVINLAIITLLNRKREFTIYYSVGMDKKRYIITMLIESIIIGLSGAIIGVILSIIVNRLLPVFAKLIDRYLVMQIFPVTIPIIVGIAMLIFVIIYIIVSLIKKTNYIYDRNVRM